VSNQSEIRHNLSSLVLEALKAGNPPWRSKYNRGVPTNALTGRKFTGINPLVLDAIADKYHYRSKYWCTYHQWHVLDIQVAKRPANFKGIYGVPIVNWKSFIKTIDKGDILRMDRFHLLKTHLVFNAEQCFGRTCGKYLILNENKKEPDYNQVEKIVESTKVEIEYDELATKAIYDRLPIDKITLPPRSYFIDDAQFWATHFHELAHFSERKIGWGDRPEHQGELFAEITTGYLESELELPHDSDMLNHEKWLPYWLEEIEKNPQYLFDAAAFAARSVDWILDKVK
jgi:antirestriction protein ArdC